ASFGQLRSPWSNVCRPMMLAPARSLVWRIMSLTGPVSPPGPNFSELRICCRARAQLIRAPHFRAPVLEAGIVPVVHLHALGGQVAVETEGDAREYFAHDSSLLVVSAWKVPRLP